MMAPNKNQYGFSLLEVLISVTLLSFIVIAIATFTETSIDSAITITSEDVEALQIETAMSRLEWDISHAYTPLYFEQAMDPQGMTPKEGEIYNQLADYYQNNSQFNLLSFSGLPAPMIKTPKKGSFIFLSAGNRRKIANSKESVFNWILYQLEPDNLSEEEREAIGTPTQMLIRKSFSKDVYTPDQLDWEDIKSQILLHKILSLEFEFWDYQKEKWTDNIDVVQLGTNILRGVRATIKYLGPNNDERISVRIFRPLYPYFDPEDMYKFLKAKTKPNQPGITEGGENTVEDGVDE